MHEAHQASVIFGLDPVWYAGVLFVLTYTLIVAERLNRAIVAVSAASLMVAGGVLTQEAAVQGIDFNTIGLLTGMMVIVGITRKSGVFNVPWACEAFQRTLVSDEGTKCSPRAWKMFSSRPS